MSDGTTQYENHVDRQYKELLRRIDEHGHESSDRTGTGTQKVFGHQMTFRLQTGFPLLTTKRVWFEGIAKELMWFLSGSTNVADLIREGVSIWTPNALKSYLDNATDAAVSSEEDYEALIREHPSDKPPASDLGPIYGKQWRAWEDKDGNEIDQIQRLIDGLVESPDSRRHMVSAWNVGEIPDMELPPCHYGFQCFTRELTTSERLRIAAERGQITNWKLAGMPQLREMYGPELDAIGIPTRALSLRWTQRSVDVFLGLPFNIASYALLTHLLAHQTGMYPEKLIFQGGDCHVYDNHVEQVQTQMNRTGSSELPKLYLYSEPPADVADYDVEDFVVADYDPHGSLSGAVAV